MPDFNSPTKRRIGDPFPEVAPATAPQVAPAVKVLLRRQVTVKARLTHRRKR